MSAFKQLKLLLWKNCLIQIRTPTYTIFEFLAPFLLIGISFGLMIGFRSSYERDYPTTIYPSWFVTGSAYDFIIPSNKTTGPQETILDMGIFSTNSLSSCPFLQYNLYSAKNSSVNMKIYYTPITTKTTEVMSRVKKRFDNANIMDIFTAFPDFKNPLSPDYVISTNCDIIGFTDESTMVQNISDSFVNLCNNALIGGVVFDSNFSYNPNEQNIHYTIRLSNTARRNSDTNGWQTSTNFASQQSTGPYNKDAYSGGSPGYWQEGFLTLQRAIDASIASMFAQRPVDFCYLSTSQGCLFREENLLKLERFPYPAYNSRIIEIGMAFLPNVIIFGLMSNIISIVRTVTQEKEDKMKEYMKIMGLAQWVNWLSHFILSYFKVAIVMLVTSILLYFLTLHSDPTIGLVLFLLYGLNGTYFAFLISTFFQSATSATRLTPLFWMILYVWYVLVFNLSTYATAFSLAASLLNSLNPCIATAFGIKIISQFEIQANGIHWSDINKSPIPGQELTMLHLYVMLILDFLILLILTWYVEAVFPSGDGVPQKPWFFVQPTYWFPSLGRNPQICDSGQNFDRLQNVEVDPPYEPVINIVNLTKIYGNGVLSFLSKKKKKEVKAVDNLNLKIFQGQITALLGHNGAGKSTTFSILSGVLSPTSGTAYINGYDIRKSITKVRESLGLCPQYNILFNNLTIMEHLEFFCKLKNCPWAPEEALEILNRLKIEGKMDAKAGKLSGGQKRKLSLAIAMIGGSKLLMLDEPTSGMDPGARHETWTLLQNERHNRTILLTTHYMEEADLLGDRIAIMSHGELQCCGSSMFLKNIYGAGYRLTVVYKREETNRMHECSELTIELLRKFSSSVKKLETVGHESTYLLDNADRRWFPMMFRSLEEDQERLGIESFGVSITTMEEVFLKVNKLADEKQPSENNNMENNEQDRLVQNNSVERFRPTRKLQGSSLYFSQAKAMFTKRYLFFRRRPGSIYGQVIAPIFYFALLTYTSTKIKSSTDQNSLPINLSVYASDGVLANIFVQWTQGNFTSSVRQGISDVNQGVSFELTETNDTLNVILEDTKNDGLTKFSKHNPLGFAWNGNFVLESKPFTIINALFNNFALHSPSLAVNLADKIMFTNSTNNFNIYVTNHPLPPSNSDKLQNTNNLNNAQFWSTSAIGFGIIVAMSLVISGFTYFLIREKKNKAKHLQIMSGVQIWFYWLTTALWDAIFFVGAIIAFTIIMNVFHIKEYTSRTDTLILVVFMMLLYGWPGLPFAYTLSFPFTNPSRAYTLVMLSSTFTAILGTIIIPLISISSKSWGDAIEIIWSLLFPTYTLSSAFNKIYNNENSRSVCASIDCNNTLIAANNRGCCGTGDRVYTDNILGTFGSKGVLLNVIILILQGFFFWFTTIALEKGWLKKIKLTKPNSEQIETDTITIEDEDVSREREIVHTLNENETPIVAKDLKKWYKDFYAVKGLSFHVNNGDCFGLLGVNGAGKTSTFQMLTGENVIDKGNAYIQGFDVTTQWRESGRLIGYCPQYDAFIKELTGEEMLYMFARIRGIFEEDIPDVVFSIIESLGLTQYAKKQIKNYRSETRVRSLDRPDHLAD